MKLKLKSLLETLEQFGLENDQRESDRQRKMLNLEPETAALIHILVRASKRHSVLEIGTSNGYSTLWLADAVRLDPAARITSIERNSSKMELARQNLGRAGLQNLVTLLEGEATAIIETLPGPYDCVFFDADRTSAPEQLRILMPKLPPNVLLLTDNVLSHPAEVAGYLAALEDETKFSSVVVPVGKGLHIAFRDGHRQSLAEGPLEHKR